MKTNNIFRLMTLAIAAVAFAFVTSCEGPTGPVGPAGDTGPVGPEGPAGADAELTCLQCHGEENQELITFQFSASQHKAGDVAVDYAGGRGSCAECHSHEGYIEWAATGDVAADIANPQAWSCKTCHSLHTTFTALDYAFRAGDDVTLVSGTVVAGENNNTCLNCHQSRRDIAAYDKETEAKTFVRKFTDPDDIAQYTTAAVGPAGTIVLDQSGATDTLVVTFDVPLTHAYISSTHAGPHHGPQGDVWVGENGSGNVEGSAFGPHSGGCVTCHMGHSFKPEEGNCTSCHASKEPEMNAVAARLEAIALKLEAIHAIHIDDSWESGDPLYGAAHPVYASLTKAQFQAWWDFMLVLEDRSKSAHNPTFVKATLTNIEAALP